MSTHFLETDRLLLRPIGLGDTDTLYEEIFRHPDVGGRIYLERPLTLAETQTFLEKHIPEQGSNARATYPWTVLLKTTGEIIGLGGLTSVTNWGDLYGVTEQRLDVEVFYVLKKAYWGQGLATELVQAAIEHGVRQVKADRIWGAIYASNLASIRVVEKAGMRRAHHFADQGVVIYEATRQTFLQQQLLNTDPAIRFNAGLDLAKQGDAAGVPALIEGFEHESPSVRLFHASKALVALGTAAIPALETALTASNPQVRMDAAYTLYHIDNSRLDQLLPLAIASLKVENRHAVTDALFFLGEIGAVAQTAVPALFAALQAPFVAEQSQLWFDDQRVLIATLLAKIREPVDEIVLALIEALKGETPELRWGAACALGEIGEAAHAAVPALSTIIRNEAEVELVRVEAAYALAVMGDPAQETLPVLTDAYQSADWWIRTFAVRILGEMGSLAGIHRPIEAFGWMDRLFMAVRNARRLDDPARQALPLLIQALADPDYNVRRNAAYALALVGTAAGDAVPALVTALYTADIGPTAAEALAKVGEAALPAVSAVLTEGNPQASAHAAYALKLMATPAAQTLLDQVQATPLTPTVQHFYLQVPVMLDAAQCAAFETLYQATLAQGKGSAVDYTLPYPKHHFLRYVVEHKGCLLHGSGKADIDVLKPMRYGIDASDHGNVSAIYADKDFVRPIYFAVIDGKRAFGQNNGFFDLTADGQRSEKEDQGLDRRYYKLAIGVNGLRRNPWRQGMVYILPPDTFEYWNEWTSRAPVTPLMRLAVSPTDLPLHADVWGADWRTFDGDNWVKPDEPFPFLKDVRTTAIQPGGRPPWGRV